jgi:hypothetical protein
MDQLGMFAKYWEPGRVKTRLAAAIGDQAASSLYRRFVLTLVQRFADVGQRRVLAYTPAERQTEFESLAAEDWQLAAQAGGNLGERMQAYFANAFRSGATRVVLIGSDSPNLPLDYVNDAFQQLDDAPVVLGPADDGGYYLVGAAGSVPPIFAGIQWSSPQVWAQTLNRLRDADCPYGVLPVWYDVDDLASLRQVYQDLADREPLDEPLRHLREEVFHVVGALRGGDGL